MEIIVSGKTVLIDDDREDITRYKWNISDGKYIKRHAPTPVTLPRVVMYLGSLAEDKRIVRYINGNFLDNRAENIEITTHSHVQRERLQKNKKTGFYGVSYIESRKKYTAFISYKGKVYNVGTSADPIEAAIMYDKKVLEWFGESYPMNFPLAV